MSKTLLSKVNQYSLVFASFVILLFGTARVSYLILFTDINEIQENLWALDDLIWVGLKFDLRVFGTISILLVYLPYLFLFWIKNSKFFLTWVKSIYVIFVVAIIIVIFGDLGYLIFFGTPFDTLIFGLFEDDTWAVFLSAVSDPKLLLTGITAIFMTLLLSRLYLKACDRFQLLAEKKWFPESIWSLLIILPLLLIMTRGSIGTFPLSKHQSSIGHHSFINSLTLNPMFHLYYAFSDRRQNGFNQSSDQILKLAKVKSVNELAFKAGFNVANPLLKKTPNDPFLKKNPPHVIFVLMEGWSSHIAMSDSEANPVLGEFKEHAQEDYFLPYFFSNQSGTNPTIENILMNSPITPLSQSSGYKTQFAMSNLLPFKNAGYQTKFLSGGASSWRNHDLFWPKQGFDKYIGRSIIEAKYKVYADNPWGVYDEYLFQYLKESLLEQKAPSFSFVLTTNNHPPVKLPSDYVSPEFDAELMGINGNRIHQNSVLKGYRYQTNELGRFLTWLKTSHLKDEVIVVATGDHVLKGFGDYQSIENQFARYGVATYLYVPKQYDLLNKRSRDTVNALYGSHVDLMPTIFELSLANTAYYNFGTSLMDKTRDNAYGWITQDALINNNGIVDIKTLKLFPWDKQNKKKLSRNILDASERELTVIQQEKYKRLYKQWLLYKDNELSLGF